MGDLSKTAVTATRDYLHLPVKQCEWTEGKLIYSKYTF